MELYDAVFNPGQIYDTLFFSMKTVLEYPNLTELKNNNEKLYNQWKNISNLKYNYDIDSVLETNGSVLNVDNWIPGNAYYMMYAPYFPEFTKIISITYGTMYIDGNGEFKRSLKKITNEREKYVINTFFDDLALAYESNPRLSLCGYNVFGNDIPFLIKRHIKHNIAETVKEKIPEFLKRLLTIKPWSTEVIDIKNVWKFNGYEATSLITIADFLELKRIKELMTPDELSKYYWDNYSEDNFEILKEIELQCATQTNMYMQIMNELRKY